VENLQNLLAEVHGSLSSLGGRLRQARESRILTLEELADSSGLTKGYLSKVERNQATPSVAGLLRLCSTLEISVGDLFDPSAGQDLVRLEDRVVLNFGGEGLSEALLTPSYEKRLQVIHSTIRPGGGSGPELYSLPSQVEFAYVLQGIVTLTLGERQVTLRSGDAITFSPAEAHSFQNLDGNNPAEVMWIFSPALPGERDPVAETVPPEVDAL
jgi:transcriptional regulator with XRE-family HTH domain